MLRIPPPGSGTRERGAGWHNLIDIFSALLRESFANEVPLDLESLQDELGAWEGLARTWDGHELLQEHPNTLDEWERMRAALWCAVHVQKTTFCPGDAHIPPTTGLPATTPSEVQDHSDWSLAFIRLLRGDAPVRRIAVPIALADEMVQLKGGIATLVLDAFFPGTGCLTLHPEESFHVLPDADFTESLNTAWRLAIETAKSCEVEVNLPDIVWRVIRESPSMSGLDEKAFFESSGLRLKGGIKGRSASGAAARAFFHLLKGTHPSPDVFVLAQVRKDRTSTSQLQGVGGVRAKVEAIADTGRTAVIIVTEQDKAEADLAVSKKQANARIEIVQFDSQTLQALYSARSKSSPPSAELKSKMDEARGAARKHDTDRAASLWEEARKLAENENSEAVAIRAQLELALLRLQSGVDLEEVVSVLDKCLQDSKSIDLGDDRARMLQLLGEAHRLKGNLDQARGFLTSTLEHSRSLGQKQNEGWALLALSALEKDKSKHAVSHNALELIQRAYDCFSSIYTSGSHEEQRKAKEGFAACHKWRAAVFDHLHLDDALTEFARALDVYRDLGEDFEWDVADVHFQRGDLHSRADDPQLAAKDIVAAGEIYKKLGDRLMEAKCVLGIAELLDQRGRRLDSKKYYESAAAIAMQQKNRKAGAWYWFRYACKLFELHEFEEGKSIFKTLLAADWLRQGQRLDILKMLCLSAMGEGQEEEMELYSKSALEIIDDQIANATSPDERRRLIISKGQCLEEQGQHDRAVACFHRGIEAFEAVRDRQGLIECWSHIAQVMGKTKKRKEEREAYEKVLSLIGDERDSFHRPMTLTMLAQLDIFEQRFDEARKRLDLAEQENEKVLNPMVMLVAQDLRSKLPPVRES